MTTLLSHATFTFRCKPGLRVRGWPHSIIMDGDVTTEMKPCLIREEHIIENAITIVNEVMKLMIKVLSFTSIMQFQFLKYTNAIWKFCYLLSMVDWCMHDLYLWCKTTAGNGRCGFDQLYDFISLLLHHHFLPLSNALRTEQLFSKLSIKCFIVLFEILLDSGYSFLNSSFTFAHDFMA